MSGYEIETIGCEDGFHLWEFGERDFHGTTKGGLSNLVQRILSAN
jgi:hypothetical protein